jgi:hypothetical protein
MIKIKNIIIFIVFFALLVFIVNDVSAYSFTVDSGLGDTGTEMGYDESGNLKQPPAQIIGIIINIALSVLGVIFLGLSIYGGFIWMNARGESSQIEKAQNIIKNSIIGLVIVLAAYAITNFVYSAFFSL